MADTTRVMVYSAQDDYLFDVAPSEVYERIRTEEINGAHSLTITTTCELAVGNRLVVADKTGKWREYVVTGVEEGHSGGGRYYAVWSIQYDLTGVTCDVMPGVRSPVSAAAALAAILDNTSQWSIGTVDVGTTGGASMWQRSAWDAISTLIEVWGGEIEPRIEVGASGVVSRKVDYRSHVGSTTVTRRFDYGADLTDIRRKVADSVRYCRIVPLGAGSTDAVESADRKRVTITSVNDGKEYLQNDAVVPIARRPDGSGGWEYPTRFVIFDGVKTPEELLETATRTLDAYTVPRVSYTASVDQFAEAGADLHGVEIGDDVDVVDKAFGGDGLRIRTRVVKLVTNELNPSSVAVTLGTVSADIGSHFSAIGKKIDGVSQALANEEGNTSAYLENIIDNLNAEINATGGYAYLTDGQGIRTYDRAVSDPLVGAEATKVVEVKGGSIRIADSKTAQGAWEWRTVFVSGHIAADLVTAAQITAGYIGSASSGNYWDLDAGTLQIGGTSAATLVSDVSNAAKVATNYLTYSSANGLDVGYSGTSAKTRINGSGVNVYDGDGSSVLYAGLSSGSSIVRVGKSGYDHAKIDSSGLTLWDGSETAANMVASFGPSSAQIGKTSGEHVMIGSNEFKLLDGSDVAASFGVDGAEINGTNTRFSVNANNIEFVYQSGTTRNLTSIASDYIQLWDAYGAYAKLGWSRYSGTNAKGMLRLDDNNTSDYIEIIPNDVHANEYLRIRADTIEINSKVKTNPSAEWIHIIGTTSITGNTSVTGSISASSDLVVDNVSLKKSSNSSTNVFSVNTTNATARGSYVHVVGKVCILQIEVTTKVAISAGGTLKVGTLVSGYRPHLLINFFPLSTISPTLAAYINTSGEIVFSSSAALATGSVIRAAGAYMLQ